MNRGILFVSIVAFAWSGFGLACHTPPGKDQIGTVDSLITRMEAALLTLNELDRGRYTRAAALYRSEAPRFIQRFSDTLDRPTAERLGNQFRILRIAEEMGRDHDLLMSDLVQTIERLRSLEQDMEQGAIKTQDAISFLPVEAGHVDALDERVGQVIANYRAVQRAWDDLGTVDSLLAASPQNNLRR